MLKVIENVQNLKFVGDWGRFDQKCVFSENPGQNICDKVK